jgi:hypothetical protein
LVFYIGGPILYIILLLTLGFFCIRKGHWVLFILGLFFPLLWLIGALIAPTEAAERRHATAP